MCLFVQNEKEAFQFISWTFHGQALQTHTGGSRVALLMCVCLCVCSKKPGKRKLERMMMKQQNGKYAQINGWMDGLGPPLRLCVCVCVCV